MLEGERISLINFLVWEKKLETVELKTTYLVACHDLNLEMLAISSLLKSLKGTDMCYAKLLRFCAFF